MLKISTTFILLLFSTVLLNAAMSHTPEDWLGRVSVPTGAEVEVVKFKTDQIVYAGTNGSGLYVSYDAGTNWGKLDGFPAEFPCVKDFLIDQNKNLWAATFGGGIYYSDDAGATWIPKNNGIKNLYIQALTITKDGRIICGTYGGGVYYSDNVGYNWVRTDNGLRYDNITCLTTMNNGRIIAGTYGGGFYVSRDTCKTWLVSNTLLENIFINDLKNDPAGNVYAATNGSGVMMTGDGTTWHLYNNKFHYKGNSNVIPLIDSAISAVGANSYQYLMGTRSAGMYVFDNLWNCWQNSGDFTVGITAIDVSPNGTILATRSVGDATRSTDNGDTWVPSADYVVKNDKTAYEDIKDFLNVYTSNYDNSLISISRIGDVRKVYKSTNHGNDWSYFGTFNSTKINDVLITPQGHLFIAAKEGVFGTLDSGKTFNLLCKENTLVNWEFYDVEYDSAMKAVVATFMNVIEKSGGLPDIIGRIYQSVDNGKTWTYQTYNKKDINSFYIDKKGTWYLNLNSQFVISTDHGLSFDSLFKSKQGLTYYGKDGNIYFTDGLNNIYYSKNHSSTFTAIPFTPENTFNANAWAVKKMSVDIYGNFYLGIMNSTLAQGMIYEVYRTSDMGTSWKNLRLCFNVDRIRSLTSDYSGYTYLLTNALYKTLDSMSLKPPKTIVPKDAQMGEELNPTLAWERAPLAEEYELQIDPTDLFFAPFETNVTGDTTCKTILNLSYNTEYYWRIRSKTHHARSAWYVGSFTTGMEPPRLVSPESGKVGIALIADLKWHSLEAATHYLIQVAEDKNFSQIVYSKDNHPDTTIKTDKLNGLKTYYWRVKAFTSNNASSWSEVWNFRTVMGPPKLIYPENKSIDKLLSEQFKWRKSTEAETYYIQIAKDTAFLSMFFEGTTQADTFKLINNMLPETNYYWHVSSVNPQGSSEYSDRWTFRTSFKPIVLQTPLDKKVNLPLNTKFSWLEAVGGNQYQIQISKENEFKTPIVDQTVDNALEFQTNKLEYYKTYYWRVRLVVGARVGLWSEIWSLKTGIETTGLLNPPDKSIDQPTTLKFKWYEVVGAKFYQLQISKNEQFTDLVYSMDSLTKAEQYVEDLEPERLYYWRVRVWNEESFGTSQWSTVWTFRTGVVTLVLRNPKSGSTGVNIPVLLTWYGVTTADYYHLQVASDAGFANIVFNKDSIYDTKWTLSKTEVAVSTDYYWHVKGVSKQYSTPWSDTWQLQTGTVSVKESELFSSIKLYPNPTGSKAELRVNYSEACDAKIFITTAEGKIIKTDVIRLLLGETRYEIDAEHLTSGSYYITIITPSGYITRELVVTK
ncbi:MAG: T9SS type A sorting domain-containing protein [bacterium]